MLTVDSLEQVQRVIKEAGADGWLLFDFHGLNPIACGMLGFEGFTSRRVFAYVPAEGSPVAISHAIEQGPWKHWPRAWQKVVYSGWRELESELATVVRGKRVAMEYSAGDAVPYLDRIPAGVLEMVRNAGAEVISSAALVSAIYAKLSAADISSHHRAAERIAEIAKDNLAEAGKLVSEGKKPTEVFIQQRIHEAFRAAGYFWDHGPIVAAGENAANPHYEPSEDNPREVRSGELLLIDLWARETDGMYADQTWMASIGAPSARAIEVWNAIRDARDAAIDLISSRLAAGREVRGAEADDACRDVIVKRGFGKYFTHRTGHSIDPRDLHGSGPHLDNLESREDRLLMDGVAFSIEPGIYIPGEIGARTEVNAYVSGKELVVTPKVYQRDLIQV